jgi:hypothetical protein
MQKNTALLVSYNRFPQPSPGESSLNPKWCVYEWILDIHALNMDDGLDLELFWPQMKRKPIGRLMGVSPYHESEIWQS